MHDSTMRLPLEDLPADIVGKAMRGLGLDASALAARCGMTEDAICTFLVGGQSEVDLGALAGALGLDADALLALAAGRHQPEPGPLPDGFAAANSPCGSMQVNAYLIWDPGTRLAALVDTGAAGPLLDIVKHVSLRLTAVLLTHTDHDHIAGLDKILRDAAITAHAPEREASALALARPFRPGARFQLGSVLLTAHSTAGHTPGHSSFTVHGLTRSVALIGDALFAGSIGKPRGDYHDQLRQTRAFLRQLPPDTLVAPGHGPLTTAAAERWGNPFLSDRLTDS